MNTDTNTCYTKSYCPASIVDPIPMPKEMQELYNSLKEKNHSCMMYNGYENPRLNWCEKNICDALIIREEMRKRNKEQLELHEQLIKNGHTCICVPEIYPARIEWCQQSTCIYKKTCFQKVMSIFFS
jgi:hypothetical protein